MEVTQRDVRVEGTDSIPQLCAEGQDLCLLASLPCLQPDASVLHVKQPSRASIHLTHVQIHKSFPPFQWLSFRPPNFEKALCWPWLVSILSSVSKPLLALIQLSSGVLMARGPFHRLADFTTSVRRGCMDLSQNRRQV